MKKRVFISSPLLLNEDDLKDAAAVVSELVEHGFSPFIQHLFVRDQRWQIDWKTAKFSWLLVSDCVLRLPGFSFDQDEECLYAVNNDIPIYETVKKLVAGEKPAGKD